jgi:cell division protein FtsL
MHRMFNGILLLATLTATVALYTITYDTRRLEAQVQAQERALERVERDVNVLRAERAHLARPERLEPLARELGLAPIESRQYLRLAVPLQQADSPAGPQRQATAGPPPR